MGEGWGIWPGLVWVLSSKRSKVGWFRSWVVCLAADSLPAAILIVRRKGPIFCKRDAWVCGPLDSGGWGVFRGVRCAERLVRSQVSGAKSLSILLRAGFRQAQDRLSTPRMETCPRGAGLWGTGLDFGGLGSVVSPVPKCEGPGAPIFYGLTRFSRCPGHSPDEQFYRL